MPVTMTTMLTLAGILLPALVGGSVIVETIFDIPGLGRLFVDATFQRDLPVLLGLVGGRGIGVGKQERLFADGRGLFLGKLVASVIQQQHQPGHGFRFWFRLGI